MSEVSVRQATKSPPGEEGLVLDKARAWSLAYATDMHEEPSFPEGWTA
jgi:hypothetical protein